MNLLKLENPRRLFLCELLGGFYLTSTTKLMLPSAISIAFVKGTGYSIVSIDTVIARTVLCLTVPSDTTIPIWCFLPYVLLSR